MKIVHMTSAHPANDVRIFFKECRSLVRRGHEVVLVVPHHHDEIQDGIKISAVPPARTRLGRMFGTTIRVWHQALTERAEIYHFHDPELIPLAIVIALTGRRIIYDAHESVREDILTKPYIPRILRSFIASMASRMERLGAHLFAGVIAATDEIAAPFSGASTIVIANYPLLEEFPVSGPVPERERGNWIIYGGVLTEERGAKTLVDAMSSHQMPDNIQLKLSGRAPLKLLTLLAGRSGWKRVHYHEWLERGSFLDMLCHARVGLCLFLPGPNHTYSYPNKLFEYMAAGVPVIASNFPGWHQIIQGARCGFTVDPNDPDAVAGAVRWIVEHPQEAATMAHNGYLAAREHFNWSREETKLLAFYDKIARASR